MRSYIEARRGQGVSDQQIKQELLDAGWNKDALGEYFGGTNLNMGVPPLVPQPEVKIAPLNPIVNTNQFNLGSNQNSGMGDPIKTSTLVLPSLENASDDERGSKSVFELPYDGRKPSKPKALIWGLGILLVLLLIGGLVGGTAATVYGSWKPWGMSSEVRRKIVVLMTKVPFAPKTTEQILLSALESSQQITRYNVDFSVAASAGAQSMEVAKVDFAVKGPVDVSTPANPQFDLKMNMGVSSAGTLYTVDAETKKSTDKKVYFKLGNVSDTIWNAAFGAMGINSADNQAQLVIKESFKPVLDSWILYDLSDLDTGARRALDEHNTTTEANEKVLSVLDGLINKPEIRGEFELVGKEDLYGFKAYHLKWNPSGTTVQTLMKEYFKTAYGDESKSGVDRDMGEFIKVLESVGFEFWFREDDFLLTKVSAVMKMDFSSLMSEGENGQLPMLGMTPLGEVAKASLAYQLSMEPLTTPVVVQIPEGAKTIQELMEEVEKTSSSGLMGNQYSNARDTQRRNDVYQIVNSIYQYTVENNGNVPKGIPSGEANKRMLGTAPGMVDLSSYLVPDYIPEVPHDPVNGTSASTGYVIYITSDGRVVVEADSELNPGEKIKVMR